MGTLPLPPHTIASVLPVGRVGPDAPVPAAGAMLVTREDGAVVTVVAPAAGMITELETRRMQRVNRFEQSIVLTLCRDVHVRLSHITVTDERLTRASPGACRIVEGRTGEVEICSNRKVRARVAEGDALGVTSGQSRGLAMIAADRRLPPHVFANADITPDERRYGRCPLEYFADSQASFLREKLTPAGCGAVQPDVPGTIVGQWRAVSDLSAIALFFGVETVGSKRAVVSVIDGTAPAGIFKVAGRAFASIKPGGRHCLRLASLTRSRDASAWDVELLDAERLRVRRGDDCGSARTGATSHYLR